MKSVFLAGLIAMGASHAASAADLAGSWVVKADFGRSARYTLICTFKADDKNFSGPCASVQGRVLPTTGSLNSGRMRLKYSTDYNGSGLDLMYAGSVLPDGTVKGEVSNRLGSGVFGAAPLTNDSDLNPQAWKLNVAFSEQIKYSIICSLKSNGTELKGPCGVGDGSVLKTSGVVDGADVTFSYDADTAGQAVHVDYAGKVQSDGSLKGTAKAGETAGTFTARRP